MGSLASITIATYLLSLAQMVKRKAIHRIKSIILKRNIDKVNKVIEIIDLRSLNDDN